MERLDDRVGAGLPDQRGKEVDPASVARELGVRYVLEGSLRVSGDSVRINAQLIDGETNSHICSDSYDRPLADLFDVRDNVTGRIASVLRRALGWMGPRTERMFEALRDVGVAEG